MPPGGGYGGSPYLEGGYGGRGAGNYIDIDRVLSAARRQMWVIGACFAVVLVLAVAYLLFATKKYTSSAEVLIDSKVSQVLSDASGQQVSASDEASVLNQIEVAQSRQMLEGVVASLKASDGVERLPEGSQIRTLVDDLNSDRLTEDGTYPMDDLQGILSGSFAARRLGRTAVLEFQFTSPYPEEAALIANTFAQVFISGQVESKTDASKRASEWLQERLTELKRQSQQAEQAVQAFKADNKIAEADGKLVSDQQLAQISTRYIEAQSETAKAEARYNRLKQIIDTRDTGAVVDGALDSDIINNMRKRYLDATKRMTELSARLGPGHEQLKRLNAEREELERLIFTELGRIAESYRSDLEVARQRQASLEESFGSMVGKNSDISKTLIDLRELEQNAEVYRKLYETFLQRAEQSTQDQSFGVSEVRIISMAQPSYVPSSPKKSLVLALAGVLGLGLGAGVGALREYRDRSIRSGDQVRRELGLEFLGEIPLVTKEFPKKEAGGAAVPPGEISVDDPLLRYAADHPMSAFTETLRAVRHAAARTRPGEPGGRMIGFGSLVPGEGKTTMALNFATLAAASGSRVLLIDTDFRNPSTSRQVASHCAEGLAEAIQSGDPIEQYIKYDPVSRMHVLPINVNNPQSHSSELLSSRYMADVLSRVSGYYDLVVLDLPPIGPIIDVRVLVPFTDVMVLVPFTDVMVLVLEWGRLPVGVIRAAIEQEVEVFERCAGVILNKVDMKQHKLYAAESARSYLSKEYTKYYKTE